LFCYTSLLDTYDTLIRVSKMNGRKASADSTMTLTDQRSLIRGELARIQGRQGKAFEALDQSGFTVLDSPAVREILQRVESGASSGVVIAYGDRLARNAWDLGGFFSRMEKAGAEIHDASMPGIDYRTPEGRQLTMMRGVSSEGVYFASKRRGDNVADQVVARGVANAVPYGYRRNEGSDPSKDTKALVPHPEHAAVVRRIFALRLEGQRVAAIMRILNDAGVPSPKGRKWSRSTVETIIRNEVYTGVVILGERRNENAHEPLVSKADWRRVQSTRAVTLSGTYKAGLAGGLVVCSGCGRLMKTAGRPGKLTYSCRGGTADGPCPRPVHVTKAIADELVLQTLAEALDKTSFAVYASEAQVAEAKAKLDEAKAAKGAWLEKADVVGLSADDLRVALAARDVSIAAAAAVYEELLTATEETADLPRDGAAFMKLGETGKRRVAASLIDRIVVSPPLRGGTPADRLDIIFRHRG
jgi:DNA invertase Pin-like site-specific DNA recombinase